MSRFKVQLISSVPGLPDSARAEITDTYHRLFDTLAEAQAFTHAAMRSPPAAHTGQVVDTTTNEVVWKTGPDTR